MNSQQFHRPHDYSHHLVIILNEGSVLLNEVIRTHISVLQKRGLAKDFIVADLEEQSANEFFSIFYLRLFTGY